MNIPLAKDLLTVSCKAKEDILQKALAQPEVSTLLENLSNAMLKSAESGHFSFSIILRESDCDTQGVEQAVGDNSAALVSDERFTHFEKYQRIVGEYLRNLGYEVSFGTGRACEISWH